MLQLSPAGSQPARLPQLWNPGRVPTLSESVSPTQGGLASPLLCCQSWGTNPRGRAHLTTHTPWHTVRGQQRQDKGRNSPPGPHTGSRHPPEPQPGCQSQTRVPLLGPAALCQGLHTCFHVSLTTPRQSREQNPRFTWEETGAPKSLGKRHLDLSPGTRGPALHLHGPHPGLLQDKHAWTPKGLLASETTLPGTYHRSAGLCFCVQELRLTKYLLAQQWTQLSAVGRDKLLPDSKVGEGEALSTRSSTEGTGTLGLGEQGRGLARWVPSKPRRALQGSELPECLAPGSTAERAGFSHYLLCHSKPAGQKFISDFFTSSPIFSRVGILLFLKAKN